MKEFSYSFKCIVIPKVNFVYFLFLFLKPMVSIQFFLSII